jgi:nitrite reductase/ring-hydroxylating ferredoxin subunit
VTSPSGPGFRFGAGAGGAGAGGAGAGGAGSGSGPRRLSLGSVTFLPLEGEPFLSVPIVPAYAMADGSRATSALVGRSGGKLRAFANVCKHLAVPLDLGDGNPMTDDHRSLLCHHHGAVFDKVTGYCFQGPCEGRNLTVFGLEVDAFGEATLVLDDDED